MCKFRKLLRKGIRKHGVVRQNNAIVKRGQIVAFFRHFIIELVFHEHRGNPFVRFVVLGKHYPKSCGGLTAVAVLFNFFYVPERFADYLVGVRVKLAVGVQLVAHVALHTQSEHRRAFVFERFCLFIRTEFPPAMTEFPRHTHDVLALFAKALRAVVDIVVTARRRQVFQLVMRLLFAIERTGNFRAAVEENTAVGVRFFHYRLAIRHKANFFFHHILRNGVSIRYIIPLFLHTLFTAIAYARGFQTANIIEQAVKFGVHLAHFRRNIQNMLLIIARQTEQIPRASGFGIGGQRVYAALGRACVFHVHPFPRIKEHHLPFGVFNGIVCTPSRRDIHHRFDTDFLARINLRAQQIVFQMRVHFTHFRGIVAPTVVAFCKQSNLRYVGIFQGFLERRLVKFFADIFDIFTRVKVQMDNSAVYHNVLLKARRLSAGLFFDSTEKAYALAAQALSL